MSGIIFQTIRSRLTPLFSREGRSHLVPTLRPWTTHLPEIAHFGQEVVSLLPRPDTANSLTLRYIVMDLLDLLAELAVIPQSPLLTYGEFQGSFNVQFRYTWNDLTQTLFARHSRQSRRVYLWAKSIYDQRHFALTYDNLFEGMSLWDIQPSVMMGPSPNTWDMAAPRLLAYSFTDQIWHTAHDPLLLSDAYVLLEEFTTIPLDPAPQCNVLLKRIKHSGLKHLEALLYPDDTLFPKADHIATARYAWMQTCLYYALVRGKLDRLGLSDQPFGVKQAVHNLDIALSNHIKHLTCKESL